MPEDEREIAEYGLSQGLVLVGGLGLAVIAGWVMGIPLLAVLFLTLTYILRIYAGGYHAKTPLRCGIISALSILICFLCLKYISLPRLLLHVLTLGAGLFILLAALGLGAMLGYTMLFVKPTYSSTSTIYILSKSTSITSANLFDDAQYLAKSRSSLTEPARVLFKRPFESSSFMASLRSMECRFSQTGLKSM